MDLILVRSFLSFLFAKIITNNRFTFCSVIVNMVFALAWFSRSCSDTETSNRPSNTLVAYWPDQGEYVGGKPDLATTSNATAGTAASKALVINADIGDPTIFELYWLASGVDYTMYIPPWKSLSYISSQGSQFWYVENLLDQAIRSVHRLVGNAVTDDRHIVIGTGSFQLIHAAIYALSSYQNSTAVKVVSASPFYSAYPLVTDFLQSKLYEWGGDALGFKPAENRDGYIEIVNSPNNPDGTNRHAVVNGSGKLIYDLAYYWPQYAPITSPADHDVMLFTLSKFSGHAGTRIGWAIVQNLKVAQLMAKYVTIHTLGVSRDAQARAAHIIRSVISQYAHEKGSFGPYTRLKSCSNKDTTNLLFHHAYEVLEHRWKALHEVALSGERFTLGHYPHAFCTFFGKTTTSRPAFAWVRCEQDKDCEELLGSVGIRSRGGRAFGVDPQYSRMSMMLGLEEFSILHSRLASLSNTTLADKKCHVIN